MVNDFSDSQLAVAGLRIKDEIIKRPAKARYFFVAMAVLFLIIAMVGFVPSYQAMHAGTLHIYWFTHIHGALMTGWLLIFLTQAVLSAKGNLKYHRQLGLFSVPLGIVVWISMGIVTFHALIGFPPHLENISWDLLLLQLTAMNFFGLFFAWGIVVRKNAAKHKRLLLMATLILLQAGIGRIQWLPLAVTASPSLSGIPNPCSIFLYTDLLLIPLFIYDFVLLKQVHKTTLLGSACIIAVQLTVINLWGSFV